MRNSALFACLFIPIAAAAATPNRTADGAKAARLTRVDLIVPGATRDFRTDKGTPPRSVKDLAAAGYPKAGPSWTSVRPMALQMPAGDGGVLCDPPTEGVFRHP
jgi:hypothetical protein